MEDFLEHLEKFTSSLMSAIENMEGQITLAENGVGSAIDSMEGPTDFQAAGQICVY